MAENTNLSAIKIGNTISREKKFGDPVNVAGAPSCSTPTASVSVIHNWPREFDQFIYSTRDYLRAIREYINNAAQSLIDTDGMTEATVVISVAAAWDHEGRADFSQTALRIRDNAGGMSGEKLRAAMQLGGTRKNADEAEQSFGRHGYGMKTATVQLALGVDSLVHIATRQIGADTGYGFSYLEPGSRAVADMCAVQVYEDANIFPTGTHGTEILLVGLSNQWPRHLPHGTALYAKTGHGCKLMTDSSTLVGTMAMRLGVDYAPLLAGQTRVDSREIKPGYTCEWSKNAAYVKPIGKKLNIVIEVCDKNLTVLTDKETGELLRFFIQPLFPAYETKPGFELLSINLCTEDPDAPGTGRCAGTLELGVMKKSGNYEPEDGIIPCKDDPRRAFKQPVIFDLFGLSLCNLVDAFPEIHGESNRLVSWGGRLSNTTGFKTDTQKTGLLQSVDTKRFMQALANLVENQVDQWVKQHEKEKKDSQALESFYQAQRVKQINTPGAPGVPKQSATEQHPVRIKGLPTAEEVEQWCENVIVLLGLNKSRDERIALFEQRIAECEMFLRDIAEKRFGYDAEARDKMVRELRVANNCIGRIDIATLLDVKKAPLDSMTESEKNSLRLVSEELKAGVGRALDLWQNVMYMLFGGDINTVTGQLLAEGFSQGAVSLLSWLRILGFDINVETYESMGIHKGANMGETVDPGSVEVTEDARFTDSALIPKLATLKAAKLSSHKRRGKRKAKLVRE